MPLSWPDIAQGTWLQSQIEQAMVPMLERMFGYYLIRLGPLADKLDTSASPIKRHLSASSLLTADIRTQETDLPLAENAVDGCVLPLCLDFCADPHQLVREAHRVVIADGHILVAGINPFSLALVGKLWPSWRKRHPWQGRFFSQGRIADWFQLLGCDIVSTQTVAFSSLLGQNAANQKLQELGGRYMPWAGSVYLMLIKKREVPLTLIRPTWKAANRIKVGSFTGAGVAGRHIETGNSN
ncbi:class I SAM-dependent methyltransferase [Neiella marina]|uniref:Class I SAM-dependent methyltransferase n=1 Tax=Neiella holothuriorum TaxID=2870530 RepID=A0ABS7EH96_9GAMM|nr:methyltransferase domain-containing protein [Neiella holothuriorum]MBW8191717.1 class I SAM-dependent methyltransferase [Neiella holothuriorum]